MWEVNYSPDSDETWISPIVCLALVERPVQASGFARRQGKDFEWEQDIRPLCFLSDQGVDYWWEESDAIGYALSELSDEEIRAEFASEIDYMRRRWQSDKEKKNGLG
jgi:hypothetical protein